MERRLIGTAVVVVVLLAGAVRVDTDGAAAAQDVLPALLAEVKGLRAAMEAMASAGPRVQLALGRLQLQEQRVNNLIRRLEETRNRLSSAQRELAQHEEQQKAMEAAFKEASTTERQEVHEMQQMFGMFKIGITQAKEDIQRLTNEEAALTADIAIEQGRWTEINQRVEELERALGRR